VAVTESRLEEVPTLATWFRFQLVPSQCSTSVVDAEEVPPWPTAHTSSAATVPGRPDAPLISRDVALVSC
jgi:hypothetical protein